MNKQDEGDRYIDVTKEEIYDSKGNRIDEAYIEEALADLNDVKPLAVRRGRPSLSEASARSAKPQVSFRVPDKMADEVRRIADKRGVMVSALARDALAAYVAELDAQGRRTRRKNRAKSCGGRKGTQPGGVCPAGTS